MADSTGTPVPKSTREDALAVVRRLRDAGHVAYFAGGCVRDLLLGQTPRDYDVATDALPQRVQELFSNTQAVGAAFGVILVRHRRSQIEVATFRAEGDYADGRRPSHVHFTTAQEDAQRRDFTINGLFLDPLTEQVIDYVGGRQDLQEGRIRAIGNPTERFEEDSLRLLRAIRFSARFNFPIEPATASAIVAHAPQLKRISPERIAEELRIMLTQTTRSAAWHMLWELNLMETNFRFLMFPRQREASPHPFLFDRVAPGEPIPFGLALASAVVCYRLQLDVELKDVRALFSRQQIHSAVQAMRQGLKISNDESEEMRATLAGLDSLLADAPPTVAKLKRFLAEPTSMLSRNLMAGLSTIGIQTGRIELIETNLKVLETTDYAPRPFIDGDLLTANGLQPGPAFKKILDSVYDAQLEDRVRSREEALALALRMHSDLNGG
jgi:poly(A) polymerase